MITTALLLVNVVIFYHWYVNFGVSLAIVKPGVLLNGELMINRQQNLSSNNFFSCFYCIHLLSMNRPAMFVFRLRMSTILKLT